MRQVWSAIVAISLLLATMSAAQAQTKKLESSLPGWQLTQKSRLMGETSVLLTGNSIKVVQPRLKTCIIARAPDWDVTVYNDSAKTRCTLPLSKWKGFSGIGFAITSNFFTMGIPLERKSGTALANGLNVNIYGTLDSYSKQSAQFFQESHGRKDPGAIRTIRLLAFGGWELPKQEGLILSRAYSLADVGDIPLQFETIDQRGDRTEGLSTSGIKRTSFLPRAFTCPPGFHTVVGVDTVRMDNIGHSGLGDLIDGIDYDLNKSKSIERLTPPRLLEVLGGGLLLPFLFRLAVP